jgi:hypothetical protein
MKVTILCIWLAGLLQLLMVAAGLIAIRKFDYRKELAKVSPLVREIFVVMYVYVVLFLAALAGACFWFPTELASGTGLGQYVCGLLAIFWWIRLAIQCFVFHPDLKRQNAVMNIVFLLTISYLTGVFTLATIGGI